MADVLFEYKSTPSFGFFGESGGYSITIYSYGLIVRRNFLFDEDEPESEMEVAFIPEMAARIEHIITNNKHEFKKVPSKLSNGTL